MRTNRQHLKVSFGKLNINKDNYQVRSLETERVVSTRGESNIQAKSRLMSRKKRFSHIFTQLSNIFSFILITHIKRMQLAVIVLLVLII